MRSPRPILACLLASAVLAAPAAAQQQRYEDLSSRDAAMPRQDLRSPDARDAAKPAPLDAPVEPAVASPAPVAQPDGHIPWELAGLGALLLGGAAALVARRRVRVA